MGEVDKGAASLVSFELQFFFLDLTVENKAR